LLILSLTLRQGPFGGPLGSSGFLSSQDDAEGRVWLLFETTPTTSSDSCLYQQFSIAGFILWNSPFQFAEDLAGATTFVHVSPLLPFGDALPTSFAVLAERIAAVEFKAQLLLVFGVSDAAHVGMLRLLRPARHQFSLIRAHRRDDLAVGNYTRAPKSAFHLSDSGRYSCAPLESLSGADLPEACNLE
jgi:hypothetical protein